MPASDELSDAIALWLGYGVTSWPQRDEARLIARYGEERAAALIPQVRRLEAAFFESGAAFTEADLAAIGAAAAAQFRTIHPEVSDHAVGALAWAYTFDYR